MLRLSNIAISAYVFEKITYPKNIFGLENQKTILLRRRVGRVVECGGLENRCAARYRGFESLTLRQRKNPSIRKGFVILTRALNACVQKPEEK